MPSDKMQNMICSLSFHYKCELSMQIYQKINRFTNVTLSIPHTKCLMRKQYKIFCRENNRLYVCIIMSLCLSDFIFIKTIIVYYAFKNTAISYGHTLKNYVYTYPNAISHRLNLQNKYHFMECIPLALL